MKLQAAIRVAERVVSEGSEVPSVVGALKALNAEVERLQAVALESGLRLERQETTIRTLVDDNDRLDKAVHRARSDEGALADDFQKLVEAAAAVVEADAQDGQILGVVLGLAIDDLNVAAKIKVKP